MLRTWPVRFEAIEFTESVRSFQVPATPRTSAWPPSLPSVPTSRATRVTSPAKPLSWSTIVLMLSFSSRISPRTSTVIFFDKSPLATAVVTSAMLRTWPVRLPAIELTESVKSFQVPATPSTLACHARHFAGKGIELVHHRVDGFLELQDFTADVHGDLLGQVAAGDCGRDLGDVADLRRQVAGHGIPAIGQILPGAGDTRHRRLAAKLAFGADLARHAGHFRGEGVELVHHRVDGILQLQN